MKPGHSGFRRLLYSTRYSLKGLGAAWRNEAAFRQELILTLVLLPTTFWLGRSLLEWLLLLGSALLVMIVELLNSAIEAIVDRIGVEHHVLSGRAKDLGSAAVFLSVLFAFLVWGSLLLSRLGVPLHT
ncbi:diacylglycerol kinase [Kushneria phosphatilytica]|uniref:Diacylglycerol kinase n=1 Tax=Kushneria phosphatilytica TaxID=657387 RepID=A0A5C0ZUE7_9GAMM|nr:diacylglycerol kinase [Kushneria phosphatilytica]QEL10170.1 diacylglycerol kinase [Kushneria phosphatilytica]